MNTHDAALVAVMAFRVYETCDCNDENEPTAYHALKVAMELLASKLDASKLDELDELDEGIRARTAALVARIKTLLLPECGGQINVRDPIASNATERCALQAGHLGPCQSWSEAD